MCDKSIEILSGELAKVVRVETGEAGGPCYPGGLGNHFAFLPPETKSSCSVLRKGATGSSVRVVKRAPAGGQRGGAAGRVCEPEVTPGRSVPLRFCRPLPPNPAPAMTLTGGLPVLLGFGESYSYLPFGNSVGSLW